MGGKIGDFEKFRKKGESFGGGMKGWHRGNVVSLKMCRQTQNCDFVTPPALRRLFALRLGKSES